MIPRAHITAWRPRAPWSSDAQIEQDLVICRAANGKLLLAENGSGKDFPLSLSWAISLASR